MYRIFRIFFPIYYTERIVEENENLNKNFLADRNAEMTLSM